MSNSVEHYALIARKARSNDEKILSVLRDYAEPVSSMNPTACIYSKSRTFNHIVREALSMYTASGIEGVVARLNRYFSDTAILNTIKVDGDFRNSMRALSQTIPGLSVDFFGIGQFITLPVDKAITAIPKGSVTPRIVSPLNEKAQALFVRLIDVLCLPSISAGSIEKIQQECVSSGIEFSDLLKYHEKETGETAIHALVQPISDDGHVTAIKTIEEFIVLGADVNALDKEGQTPLLKASILGLERLATALVEDFGAKKGLAGGRKSSFGFIPEDFMSFEADGASTIDLLDQTERSEGSRTPVTMGGRSVFDDENPGWALDLFASAHQRSRSRSSTPTNTFRPEF